MRFSSLVAVLGVLVAVNCHAGLLGGVGVGLLVLWAQKREEA